MSSPILSGDGAVLEQLYLKTDWTFADFGSSPFAGPDTYDLMGKPTQNRGINPLALPQFQLWKYDMVMLSAYATTLVGGSSPKLNVSMWGFESGPANPGFFPISNANLPIGAGGGGMMYLVETMAGIGINTGLGNVNAFPVVVTYKPFFGQLQLQLSGSPTDATGIRVAMYGRRKPNLFGG